LEFSTCKSTFEVFRHGHGQPGNQILQTNSSGARDYFSEDEVENNVFNILQVR
jgi:hypothetical protein